MRAKKAIKNIIAAFIMQIVAAVCAFIGPRLILVTYGSTYNGIISSVTQFLNAISILTIGIAGSTRLALYKTLSNNDVLGTSRIIKSHKKYMRRVALCLAIYSLVLIIVYPYISHNDIPDIESRILIIIVSIGIFARYFFGISAQTLLTADQSDYINSITTTISTICNTLIIAIMISKGFSIFHVKAGGSLVLFISPIVLSIIVARKYHLVSDCEPDDAALTQRKAVAFHSIANIIHNNTDLVLLTLFTTAKVISVYSVYYLVISKVKDLLKIFTNGMESAFGSMWAQNEQNSLKRGFKAFELFMYMFTAIVFSCVWVLIIPFIKLYTKNVNDINYILPVFAVLLIITESVFCIREPYLILVQATGNYEATKKDALREAIFNIIISLILVGPCGIYGVIVGTLFANLYRTIRFAWFISKEIFPGYFINVAKKTCWLVMNMFIIIVICECIKRHIGSIGDWETWIVLAFISMVVSLFIVLISAFFMYREEVMTLVRIIQRKNNHKR